MKRNRYVSRSILVILASALLASGSLGTAVSAEEAASEPAEAVSEVVSEAQEETPAEELTEETEEVLTGDLMEAPGAAGSVKGTNDSTTWFETIQSEIDRWPNGESYELPTHLTGEEQDTCLTIKSGKDITLIFRGDCIVDRNLSTAKSQGYVFYVEEGATVTMTGGGTITGGNNRGNGGAIYNKGTLILQDINITGNRATEDGLYYGGGIYNEGTLIINGGSIANNTSSSSGGGIYNYNTGTIIMTGGSISGNTASGKAANGIIRGSGGGIYNDGTLIISGGSVTGNKCAVSGGGGGIYVDGGAVKIYGSPKIYGNTSANNTDDNLHLKSGKVINVTDNLSANAQICVTTDTEPAFGYPVVITSGLKGKGSVVQFVPDNTTCTVIENGDGEAGLYVLNSELARIWGISGSFNDRIKLNFYFTVNVMTDAGAYVTLTNISKASGTETSVTLPIKDAQLVEGKGYKFSIPLAAKEAGDTITARVFDGQGNPIRIEDEHEKDYTQTGVQFSLMQYFTWLETNGTESERPVGTAAKDYCAAAQIYFNYNAAGLSVSSAVGAVSEDELSGFISQREGTLPAGVTIRGISAMVEADNTLRLYLKFDDGVNPEGFTYTIDDNAATLNQRSDGAYYLALKSGVYSNHLQDTHTYSISDGTDTYTVTASVLTYARACAYLNDTNLVNLGKAL